MQNTLSITAPSSIQSARREPLGHLLFEQHLKDAGFAGGIFSDVETLEAYSNDESIFTIAPRLVLQPQNARDVEIAVKVLAKQTKIFPTLSLTPRAAGTGLGGGSLTDSVVIDVCAHMHEIADAVKKKDGFSFTCQSGALYRDVEKMLKKHGAYIPAYPASKDICTIGGAVANNAAGPDSLKYGHTSHWVEALTVVLRDGKSYTIKPISYKEFKALTKKKNALSEILKETLALIEKNEKTIYEEKPKTKKNSAGYALWDVLDVPVSSFKRGKGTFNLLRLLCGSQGTIGIITDVTMRAIPIPAHTKLIAAPVFNLADASTVILKALEFDPINIELFDGLTFNLALKHPEFFRNRLPHMQYYQVLLSMYTLYHVRYAQKTPEFTLLITLPENTHKHRSANLVSSLQRKGAKKARLITNAAEREMFWQIRRASYSLSKFQDPKKRPAAFLEDMLVPPQALPRFFLDIKQLLKKYNVTAAVHGHGGDGHLHFYPLLDFESKATPALVLKMAEEFFATARKYDGNICGEHNDGIIRTPHLSKMFSAKMLDVFKTLEHLFDPDDIFNPGKKVNPRFDVQASIRTTNNSPAKKKY